MPGGRRLSALVVLLTTAALTSGCDVAHQLMGQRSEGERLWRRHCAECHGINAGGSAPPYNGNPWADLLDDDFKYGGTDGDFEEIIRTGASSGTRFGEMPGNSRLTDTEIELIVRHLRELRGEG